MSDKKRTVTIAHVSSSKTSLTSAIILALANTQATTFQNAREANNPSIRSPRPEKRKKK